MPYEILLASQKLQNISTEWKFEIVHYRWVFEIILLRGSNICNSILVSVLPLKCDTRYIMKYIVMQWRE